MRRISILSTLALVISLLTVAWAPSAAAADPTTTVRYGPFTIPAGTMTDPGMIHNRLLLGVKRPCSTCYITSMDPDLVYEDGTPATMADGPMLHHAVWTSQWRPDATCSGSWLGLAGERFFASGNERTTIAFPPGYGYKMRSWDSWNLLVDLMNHSETDKTVYVEVTFSYQPGTAPLKHVRPVWLDIDQCGDSEYSIPAGYSDTHWTWNVNVPGRVVAMLGHVHGHGIAVEATKGGKSICRSVATLEEGNPHEVLAMSTCRKDALAVLSYGNRVTLHSEYNSTHPANDVMGIMLGWVSPS